jgi:hypothetical protein
MAIQNLKCPNCGGSLEISDDIFVASCEYCGTKHTITKSEKQIEDKTPFKSLKNPKYVLAFANRDSIKTLYIFSLIISCFCAIYFFVAGILESEISLLFDFENILNFFLLIISFISIAPIFIFKKIFKYKIIAILLQGITMILSFMWFIEWIDLAGLQITFSVIVNLIIQIIWFLIICFVKKEEIK